ncbi:MAG: putative Ig domain-containing protein, partial [Planctomycetia bacterium]
FDYAASNELDDGMGTTLNYGVIAQNPTTSVVGDLLPSSGTTGLAITFEEDFGSDITVRFNGNQLANQTAPSFVSGSQAIQVTMTEAGYLTVTVGSTDVITNLLVPGYASADKSAWKFGFGANAGPNGFNNGFSAHLMDNLQISGLQSLPAGVSLNPLTGLLSGTPTGNAANYGFNIVSTNSAGTATQAFTLLNTNTQTASPAATYIYTNNETST